MILVTQDHVDKLIRLPLFITLVRAVRAKDKPLVDACTDEILKTTTFTTADIIAACGAVDELIKQRNRRDKNGTDACD
jgi:hypothetical protein